MKHKRWLTALFLSVSLTAGCRGAAGPASAEEILAEHTGEKAAETEHTEEKETGEKQTGEEPTEEEPTGETEETLETAGVEAGFSFADVADREFYFSSGAGAWYTVLHIHEDGTFDGHYQDADMGDVGMSYPNGTLYYSDFSGRLTEPEKIDDMTYAFQVASIEYPHGQGEEIRNGCRYIYDTAYGLDGAEDLYLYLPGSRVADLPESYRRWVGYYNEESIMETRLPYYGLYNVKEENGFSSYAVESVAERAKAVLSGAEERAAALEERLSKAQTQGDMNEISGELYENWDDALNMIWGLLKETLEEDAMRQLTEEERVWIQEKEAAASAAGAEAEGGSLQALLVNDKVAELTKKRVYELAERLR